MPRSVRIEPSVYLGVPGALNTLPWPRGGINAGVQHPVFDFMAGSGTHRVSTLVSAARTYTLNWLALHQTNFDLISPFWTGHMGPGPFCFIDPTRPNLLTLNQSSAASATGSGADMVSNFGPAAANFNTAFIRRFGAPSSIKWQPNVTGSGTAILSFPPVYQRWPGIPVVPGREYTWQFWIIYDSVDTSINSNARVVWLKADGTTIRTDNGATLGTSTGWQYGFLGGPGAPMLAPANAAYALPSVCLDIATLASQAIVYIDQPNFEMTSKLEDWAPGTGVWPVMPMSLPEDIAFDAWFRTAPTLVLQEVK